MKSKEKVAYRNASIIELQKKVREEKDKLARMLVERYTKQSKNTREFSTIRRTIAVLSTIIRQKELEHATK